MTLHRTEPNPIADGAESWMRRAWIILVLSFFSLLASSSAADDKNADRIQPYAKNPCYWQYQGEPVLLLGGSDDDNLFQWDSDSLTDHLDLLVSVGGNYDRCVMSCRNDKGFEIWPYQKTGDVYNLDQWNPAFWERFSNYLEQTHKRDIIVQIELWATYDFYGWNSRWDNDNPYNPRNNSNYTSAQSGLPETISYRPGQANHPEKYHSFFWTVPSAENNRVVLKYQEAFVDKMLSYTLEYPHILYQMDNECYGKNVMVFPDWGYYWSDFIKAKAQEQGVQVETTEQWGAWKDRALTHLDWKATIDHPEQYSFIGNTSAI